MRLVGYNDLQARSAYQPIIHKQGDRYIAYIGHHGGIRRRCRSRSTRSTGQAEFNGTSIVDVTDPANPKYLKHIPGRARGSASRAAARWCASATAQSLPKGDPQRGLSAAHASAAQAHEIWNVADPANPKLVSRIAERQGHAQELVGMRHRHCLSGLRRWRLAHPPHDRDLRPQRSGQAGEDPRLRPRRAGAGRDRRGADRPARIDLDRAAGQPRLFRATAPTRAASCRSSTARSC